MAFLFRLVEGGAATLFYLVVALAPLPLGSAEPETVAIWCVVLGVAVILASLLGLGRAQLIFIGLVSLLGAAYGIVLHEQLSVHPWFASHDPIWKEAAELLGMPIEPSVSIAKNQPMSAMGAPLAAMLSFLCGLMVCANRLRAHQLVKIIAWSGA